MMKNPELARQMRALRTVNHYTQQQIADLLNIDRTTYTSYEISKNTPDIMLLDAFARIFHVDLDFILHIDTQNVDALCDEIETYVADNKEPSYSLVSQLDKDERTLIAAYRLLSDEDKEKVRELAKRCNPLQSKE